MLIIKKKYIYKVNSIRLTYSSLFLNIFEGGTDVDGGGRLYIMCFSCVCCIVGDSGFVSG